MDQDAFREMLSLSASNSTGGQVRQPQVTFPGRRKPAQKEAESSSTSTFKPRNHKNDKHAIEKYRDRATERRGGVNDYAEVEKVMVDFENANAEEDVDLIEERRKMLGGDEKHTVLVKGLDFALLEQQKAKLDRTQDMQDEALLEQAFKEATAPKKRTREEIVEKLRKSRGSASSDLPPPDKGLETAKSMGRFRPIGAPVESKVKKRKNKTGAEDADKKSKKRKTEETSSDKKLTKVVPESKSSVDDRPPPTVIKEVRPRTPSPDIDVDVDIFADVGEYRGFGSDSGSDAETGEEDGTKRDQAISNPRSAAEGRKTDWFGNPLSEEKDKPTAGNSAPTEAIKGKGKLTREPDQEDSDMEPGHEPEPEPEQPSRLQPLASSSVPSIREILARDEAAEREEKRKARKEKKKNKKPSETTKINREAKQLEEYVAAKNK